MYNFKSINQSTPSNKERLKKAVEFIHRTFTDPQSVVEINRYDLQDAFGRQESRGGKALRQLLTDFGPASRNSTFYKLNPDAFREFRSCFRLSPEAELADREMAEFLHQQALDLVGALMISEERLDEARRGRNSAVLVELASANAVAKEKVRHVQDAQKQRKAHGVDAAVQHLLKYDTTKQIGMSAQRYLSANAAITPPRQSPFASYRDAA